VNGRRNGTAYLIGECNIFGRLTQYGRWKTEQQKEDRRQLR